MNYITCRLVLLLQVFITLAAIAAGRTVCPVNMQNFLSTNRELLPTSNILSSSEHTGFNEAEDFVGTDTWCSMPLGEGGVPAGQYVELTFTKPVVVTLLTSGGFLSSYVNNFTILSTLSTTGDDFQPYGELRNEQAFIVQDIESVDAHFTLETPILARRIKFLVKTGILDGNNRICWKMVIFGCTYEEARSIPESETTVPSYTRTDHISPSNPTVTTSTSTSSPSTTQEMSRESPSTTKEMSRESPSTTQEEPLIPTCQGEKEILRNNLLLIVLPTAVVVVIIVLIITTLGVLICLCCVRQGDSQMPVYETVKVKMVNSRTRELVENGASTSSSGGFHYDNPRPLCYDVPRLSTRSRQGSTAESISTLGSHLEIKNPAYVTKKSLGLQDVDCIYHLPPDDDANDYDIIPDTPTEHDQKTKSNSNQSGSTSSTSNKGVPDTSQKTAVQTTEEERDEGKKTASGDELGYSKVNKFKNKNRNDYERTQSSSPTLHGNYNSSNNTHSNITKEISEELERSITSEW